MYAVALAHRHQTLTAPTNYNYCNKLDIQIITTCRKVSVNVTAQTKNSIPYCVRSKDIIMYTLCPIKILRLSTT